MKAAIKLFVASACVFAVVAWAVVFFFATPKTYSQATPDDVIASARAMLKSGEPERIHELIYGEDEFERAFLRRLGSLLGHLKELTVDVQTKFPKDMEKLKAEAEAQAKLAAKRGTTGAGALVNQIVSAGRSTSRDQRESLFEDLITQIFADPYGWLEDQSGRLTTELVTDDQAAVLWETKPILPPVGLAMRKVEDKWYFVPPMNLPFIAKYRPRTKDEWNLWASMIRIFDNAIVELRDEVRTGQVAGFGDVSRKAGEKIFMPAALAGIAIGKYYENKFKAAATPTKP